MRWLVALALVAVLLVPETVNAYPQIEIRVTKDWEIVITSDRVRDMLEYMDTMYPYNWSRDDRFPLLIFSKNYKDFPDNEVGPLNPYGKDLVAELCRLARQYGWKSMADVVDSFNFTKAVRAIEGLDSDGDGYTNGEELRLGSLPGFADDVPKGGIQLREALPYIYVGVLLTAVFAGYFVTRRFSS